MSAPPRAALEPLTPADFASYFTALWATEDSPALEPFPWQVELVEAAHRERRWPDVIDLPTGSGKTSLIDLAVYLLALGAEEPPGQQWHPRRIAVVVDRRVIVDQAADRARNISERLKDARSGVLRAVADRLRSLALQPDGSSPETPLRHAVLRGGIVRDESWAYRPDVPAVIASTVDQVGSRLMFRGYGVSRGMRPIHAGLLSEDVLYLLDEVHLARPYAETLEAVGRYRRLADRGTGLPDRWQMVQLSATVDDARGWVFPGRALDPGSHSVLGRRLTARKPAALVEVATPAEPSRAQRRLAAVCAQRALALVNRGARTVAVIVNRVATARLAYAAVCSHHADVHACLVTGRMRPIDRDHILAEIKPRVANGRQRQETDQPLVLIATQSIEAGADFDLDAIVTECASLDALRQRFGRVDRDGALGATGQAYESSILISSSDAADGPADPVYGDALRMTWRWLRGLDAVDFGIQQLRLPEFVEDLEVLLPPRTRAPYLLPGHLDRWVRTSHYGVAADPDVVQWLHGIEASNDASDVSVIWREDIDEGLLAYAAVDGDLAGSLAHRVDACPPRPREMLAVPLVSLRAWLRGGVADLHLADTWTNPEPVAEGPRSAGERRAVLRWRDDHAELVGVSRVAPGDTIVVPAAWGGITAGTWDPASTVPVVDLAAEAYIDRQPLIRLSRVLDERWRVAARLADITVSADGSNSNATDDDAAPAIEFPDPAMLAELSSRDRATTVRAYLTVMIDHVEDATRDILDRMLAGSSWSMQPFAERLVAGEPRYSYVVTARTPASRTGTSPYSGLAEDDGRDGPSFADAGVPSHITLADHLDGVRRWAECLAANLGFSSELTSSLGRAGQLHDVGKLDPRFQLWLRGGNELALAGEPTPLAKSVAVNDRHSREVARLRSDYPVGQRHELLSLSLCTDGAGGPYADLVRHLIATHHGNGRYRFDPQGDMPAADVCFCLEDRQISGTTTHSLEQLDSGIADRFWGLIHEWGWFGLAWLEAVVRLADHQDSRSPQVAARARNQQ